MDRVGPRRPVVLCDAGHLAGKRDAVALAADGDEGRGRGPDRSRGRGCADGLLPYLTAAVLVVLHVDRGRASSVKVSTSP